MKNNTGQRHILAGLFAALIAAGLIGWLFGGVMKNAVEVRQDLTDARAEYRELLYSTTEDGKAGTAREEVSGELERLKTLADEAGNAYEEHSLWYGFYRISSFSGKLFLNLLNLLVIPLIFATVVMGMVALGDLKHVGRTGARTVLYYIATTSVSVIIGLVLVQIIVPGAGMESSAVVAESVQGKEDLGILDTVLKVFVDEGDRSGGAFPGNIFGAMARMNVLGVIVFSLLFGAALASVGEKGRSVVEFFDGLNEVILKLIHWVLYLLPVGIFGLVLTRLADIGGGGALFAELTRLGWYALTVVAALAIHAFIVLPLILRIFTGRSALKYASGMAQALVTAFSTASSSATLPTTLECVEKRNKVSARSASFVLPLGATINMDGTALYEAVAVVFIAQVYGVEMGPAMLIIVFLTATLAAVGAAGIPEAGLVTMVIVLNATGLPLEGIAILLSIDWLLDRCRTTVNVWGDSIGAAVIDRYETDEGAGGGVAGV